MTSASIAARDLQFAAVVDSIRLTAAGQEALDHNTIGGVRATAGVGALALDVIRRDPFDRAEAVAQTIRRRTLITAWPDGEGRDWMQRVRLCVAWQGEDVALATVEIPASCLDDNPRPRALALVVADILAQK
jgi:hypothetical protein